MEKNYLFVITILHISESLTVAVYFHISPTLRGTIAYLDAVNCYGVRSSENMKFVWTTLSR